MSVKEVSEIAKVDGNCLVLNLAYFSIHLDFIREELTIRFRDRARALAVLSLLLDIAKPTREELEALMWLTEAEER